MLMNPFLLPLSLSHFDQFLLSLPRFRDTLLLLSIYPMRIHMYMRIYIYIYIYIYIHIHMCGRTTIHRNSFAFIFVRISDFVSTLARVNVQIIK